MIYIKINPFEIKEFQNDIIIKIDHLKITDF